VSDAQAVEGKEFGARGGIRTHTPLRIEDFKSFLNTKWDKGNSRLVAQIYKSHIPECAYSVLDGHNDGHNLLMHEEWSSGDISRIVESGNGEPRNAASDYGAFAKYVNAGAVRVGSIKIPKLAKSESFEFDRAGAGGGANHQVLKYSALCWLHVIGGDDARYEAAFPYGVHDVRSDSLGLSVECGSTDCAKIISALMRRDTKNLAVIPFSPDSEILDVFSFSRGELFGMLAQDVDESRNKEQERINRRAAELFSLLQQ
jgi:hypothetical protein